MTVDFTKTGKGLREIGVSFTVCMLQFNYYADNVGMLIKSFFNNS